MIRIKTTNGKSKIKSNKVLNNWTDSTCLNVHLVETLRVFITQLLGFQHTAFSIKEAKICIKRQ